MKTIKKGCKSESKINIDNYLIKKDMKREYGTNGYRSLSEEDKQKLREYQENYHFFFYKR